MRDYYSAFVSFHRRRPGDSRGEGAATNAKRNDHSANLSIGIPGRDTVGAFIHQKAPQTRSPMSI